MYIIVSDRFLKIVVILLFLEPTWALLPVDVVSEVPYILIFYYLFHTHMVRSLLTLLLVPCFTFCSSSSTAAGLMTSPSRDHL